MPLGLAEILMNLRSRSRNEMLERLGDISYHKFLIIFPILYEVH